MPIARQYPRLAARANLRDLDREYRLHEGDDIPDSDDPGRGLVIGVSLGIACWSLIGLVLWLCGVGRG